MIDPTAAVCMVVVIACTCIYAYRVERKRKQRREAIKLAFTIAREMREEKKQ